jgi:CheY-like chemotaxis protein/anti-sigma regulatory factor (Ser/Thr protein kinase)
VKVGSRATELVQRILTFAARQLPVAGCTSIRTAIEEALSLLRSSVPDTIALQVRHAAQDLTCVLGADELQQVMINLITNAVHAIGARQGSIEIDVSADELPAPAARPRQGATRAARISVRDSGSGMDAATRQRMFDPFFTTKPFGQGTGLGLAVVHGIVQACGGCIEAVSEVNAGSTLTLWVPLSAASEMTRTGSHSDYRGHGEHILYVDDEEAITFLIERLLSGKGYRVTCCNSPTAALELLRGAAQSIDVLVSDLTMPALNGIDLIRHARDIRPDLPAILTSGYVREEDRARAKHAGIEHVILKPNTIDEMGATLHQLFEQIRRQHS